MPEWSGHGRRTRLAHSPAPAARRLGVVGLALAALVLTPATLPAQGTPPRPSAFPSHGARSHGERVQISAEALPQGADPSVDRLLAEGRRFESQELWGDAVTHYEDALRKHPGHQRLEQRFDTARLHFSLERRYNDTSFLGAVKTLSGREAVQLYGELLRKIDSHYVVAPPWAKIARRGTQSLQAAIADEAFRRQHGLRVSRQQGSQFNAELSSALAAKRGAFRTRHDVLAYEAEVARMAAYRLGIRPTATAMEFSAAAAGGLDNYSGFLTPGQLRDVYSQIEGNFVGLGVELKADNGALLIVRVIPNSPAERSGIRAGDRITAVDGSETASLSTDEAAGLLTGEAGSLVRVRVTTPAGRQIAARPVDGLTPPNARPWTRDVTVRREHVDVPALEDVKIVDKEYGVAYVRIPVFQKTTSRDLESSLWDLHRKGMRSLVIDLRGNPGGLLTSSVELADKFVVQGNIVSTRGRSDGEDFDYRAHRAGTWRVPLVVLIDGDSASASEIFAAAIRDNRRGSIVGDRSFGKGSVQGIFPLGFGGAGIRLTTAKFFSPNGDPISKVGVTPDIVVRHADGVADGRHEVGYRGPGEGRTADAALSKAVEAARRQLALR